MNYEEEKISKYLQDIKKRNKPSCFEYFDQFLFKNEYQTETNLPEKQEEKINSSDKKKNINSSKQHDNENSSEQKENKNSSEQKENIHFSEQKKNINNEELVNSLNTAEKKKRRMTNSSEDEEIFKNIYLKKKKFKFESPLANSISKINPSNCKITSNNIIKDNSSEDTIDPQAEKEIFKKFHRLRKIKEINDENTCTICLGNLF